MRIVLVVGPFQVGGVETFLLRLGKGLKARGHEVSLLATDSAGPWWPKAAEAGLEAATVFPGFLRTKTAWVRKVAGEIRRRAPDAVLLNDSWSAAAGAAMLGDGPRVAGVIHNDAWFVLKLACANGAAMDFLAAPSPRLVEAAAARGVDRGKIRLIAHGVEAPPAPPNARGAGRSIRAVYVGRLQDSQKGVMLLPAIVQEAVARKVDLNLEIVGSGPDEARLRRHVETLGVGGRVRFRGRLPNAEVIAILGEAHLLLMPSRFEGLPMLPLEAMANGCLVVASRLEGIRDWMLDGGLCGCLAEKDDAGSFAAALVRLDRDPSGAERMRERAWERVRAAFSIDAMTDGYLRAFEAAKADPVRRSGLGELSRDIVSWKDRLPVCLARPMEKVRRSMESFWPTSR